MIATRFAFGSLHIEQCAVSRAGACERAAIALLVLPSLVVEEKAPVPQAAGSEMLQEVEATPQAAARSRRASG